MKPRTPFRRIGVSEFDERRRNGALVLDVRDRSSFDAAHVEAALHVSHANLSDVLAVTARTRPVLIYCYHGNASREYAQIFSDFGFAEVCSLDGGFEAWHDESRASIR
ncbi:thiosulfate sulfurtransferase GlpE [Bradyrhizobium sp.]|uniref:thiosulfate sulfurtransferase GlpE n=1 Tax=Bradyrhizobium sp. TaxID=376 RepID=UPI004037A87C